VLRFGAVGFGFGGTAGWMEFWKGGIGGCCADGGRDEGTEGESVEAAGLILD